MEWPDDIERQSLNCGEPAFTSSRSRSHSETDLAAYGDGLARRATCEVGQVGQVSDHLPMIDEGHHVVIRRASSEEEEDQMVMASRIFPGHVN